MRSVTLRIFESGQTKSHHKLSGLSILKALFWVLQNKYRLGC